MTQNRKKENKMIEPTAQQQINISQGQNEINKLSGINFKNKTDRELMEAASQFEAVFVNQLFKAMEATVERDGLLSGGKGEEMFRSMFYEEIARDISSNPATSFGFAKQIYEQMKDLV